MPRKRLLQIGLALLTAVILIGIGHQPSYSNQSLPAQSQPAVIAQNRVTPTTSPTVSPSPKASPGTTASPKPTATPTQKTPAPAPKPEVPRLSLTNQPYQDPAKRFEIGLIQDYKTSEIRGIPLIESPDGNIAYTVLVKPQFSNQTLSNEALAKVAVDALNQGEKFQADEYESVGPASIEIPWTGSLTLGTKSQPVSGTILARQEGQNVILLLISATKEGSSQVESVLATLSDTLKVGNG
jgi:hypothetical protein